MVSIEKPRRERIVDGEHWTPVSLRSIFCSGHEHSKWTGLKSPVPDVRITPARNDTSLMILPEKKSESREECSSQTRLFSSRIKELRPKRIHARSAGNASTSDILIAPVAIMTRRSKPRATPEQLGSPDFIAAAIAGAPGRVFRSLPFRTAF